MKPIILLHLGVGFSCKSEVFGRFLAHHSSLIQMVPAPQVKKHSVIFHLPNAFFTFLASFSYTPPVVVYSLSLSLPSAS